MILGYLPQLNIVWNAFQMTYLNDVAGNSTMPNFNDGDPQTPGRFTVNTSTSLVYFAEMANSVVFPARAINLVGLMGTTLPVGTLIRVYFSSVTVGDYPPITGVQGRVIQMPRGERCVWLKMPVGGPTDIQAVYVDMLNDANGVTWMAGGTYEIGEVWVSESIDLAIDQEPSIDTIPAETVTRGITANIARKVGLTYRRLTCRPVARSLTSILGGVLDLEQLMARIDRGQRCVAIPYKSLDGTTDSAQAMNRSAIYGVATVIPSFTSKSKTYANPSDLVIEEVPSPPA